MKAYSLDLREKIAGLYDVAGISQWQIAARFCVSVFFVKKLFASANRSAALLQNKGTAGKSLD
ncbi:MAG: hypothetical protein M3209_11455 [Acidobacteriota bacterium]|nr:hypothetical protein [Acidobacteriota bacterium]